MHACEGILTNKPLSRKFLYMKDSIDRQESAFDKNYIENECPFHDTKDPFIRYIRDRRLNVATNYIKNYFSGCILDCSILIVCGGVGGEGTYYANEGFKNVTVSDFSQKALDICRKRDPRLNTLKLNAEALPVEQESFDIVVIQDGLHHLTRPILGFTEMIRVAKIGVVVIEPHLGVVPSLIGRKWENVQGVINFVFRWNENIFSQVVKSYLLKSYDHTKVIRLWDHNVTINKILSPFGNNSLLKRQLAKILYGFLDICFVASGNNMIGIVIKKDPNQ